jgi:hypothetical protein
MAERSSEQSIFLHAIAWPTPAERAAYLDAVYRDRPALRAELAGTGKTRDDPPPDGGTKAQLRRQARDWLQADLTAYAKLLAGKDPQAGSMVRQRLQHWKSDADLAGLRDRDAVAKLPAEKR